MRDDQKTNFIFVLKDQVIEKGITAYMFLFIKEILVTNISINF